MRSRGLVLVIITAWVVVLGLSERPRPKVPPKIRTNGWERRLSSNGGVKRVGPVPPALQLRGGQGAMDIVGGNVGVLSSKGGSVGGNSMYRNEKECGGQGLAGVDVEWSRSPPPETRGLSKADLDVEVVPEASSVTDSLDVGKVRNTQGFVRVDVFLCSAQPYSTESV